MSKSQIEVTQVAWCNHCGRGYCRDPSAAPSHHHKIEPTEQVNYLLAELKAHYQVEKNYFNGVEDEDTVSEDSDPLLESSTLENSTFNNDLTG